MQQKMVHETQQRTQEGGTLGSVNQERRDATMVLAGAGAALTGRLIRRALFGHESHEAPVQQEKPWQLLTNADRGVKSPG